MRNSVRRVDSILVAAMALSMWVGASAPVPASQIAAHPVGRAPAPLVPVAQNAPDQPALRVVDDLGTRLDLYLPPGTTRAVIQPASDDADGSFGWVLAYDAQGNELLRQRETIGIAFQLGERGLLVGLLNERADAPVELRVPAGTARVRLVSQNFDSASDPRRDGKVLAYGADGSVIAEDNGLALDVLTP